MIAKIISCLASVQTFVLQIQCCVICEVSLLQLPDRAGLERREGRALQTAVQQQEEEEEEEEVEQSGRHPAALQRSTAVSLYTADRPPWGAEPALMRRAAPQTFKWKSTFSDPVKMTTHNTRPVNQP